MPMSRYMRALRAKVGTGLLVVPSVAVVVRDERGRVFLARHGTGGIWAFPGGAVEPLEAPANAAVREMWEETGLVVEPTRIVGVYGGPEFVVRYANGDETSYVITVLEARRVGGEPRPDGEEVLEVRWVARDEVDALKTPPWMPEMLRDVFDETQVGFRKATWTPRTSGE
jgi:8-oxo-dGTP pyrophosphatase MutT (NUDIX family)